MESCLYPGCYEDLEWRLNHLYFINTKNAGVIRFRMNWAQKELFAHLHNRNTILKVRQLGMSTFVSILMLDRCLFTNNFEAGIIDMTEDDAREKVRKIALAMRCLANPPRNRFDHVTNPDDFEKIRMFTQALCASGSAAGAVVKLDEICFANGSHVRSGLSLRGGTIHLLHVSEYGKTAARDPGRAEEIKNGGFQTVASDGCIIIESTHEGGMTGDNYRILKAGMDNVGKRLTPDMWRFFFLPWWRHPDYRTRGFDDEPFDAGRLLPYFEMLEKQHGIVLDDEQKRWYYNKESELGWSVRTEYPSVASEALIGRIEGSIYGTFLLDLRKDGRMNAEFEVDEYHPMYVSWDLGVADFTCMWLWQVKGDGRFYAVDYYCSHNKRMDWYFNVCRKWEADYGIKLIHLLPHDAKQTEFETGLPRFMAFDKAFGSGSYRLVKRISDKWLGIDEFKNLLRHCVFHSRCSVPIVDPVTDEKYMSGVDSLENYRTKSVSRNGTIQTEPLHDESSHGADAARMFAEAYRAGFISKDSFGLRPQSEHGFSGSTRRLRAKGVPAWI